MQYLTLTPINYNGYRYEAGEKIELSARDARALIDAKAVEPVARPFAAPAEQGA